MSAPAADDVVPEGVGDGRAVIVGEVLPDRGGADAGVCLDHRVDDGVQAVHGRWLAGIFFRAGDSLAFECPLGHSGVEIAAYYSRRAARLCSMS